jgi:hypothetical protein
MTPSAAQAIAAAATAWPRDVGSATAVVESLSGAVSDVDPRDTAFPWRRQAACIQWYADTPSPNIVDAASALLATAHETMGGEFGWRLRQLRRAEQHGRGISAEICRGSTPFGRSTTQAG